MPWGPDDWDAWITSEATRRRRPGEPVQAVRDILQGIPGRRRMTVADLGCGAGSLLPFLGSHFGHVVAIDYAPASLALARNEPVDGEITFRRRDLRDLKPFRHAFEVAVAVDSIVGPRPEDIDRALEQVHRSLVEAGLLVATFPAAARRGQPRPFRLSGDGEPPAPVELQEVELQYRLRRAGFRGIRLRRFPGTVDLDTLLCVATRRANN